jgi:hypothetical protein
MSPNFLTKRKVLLIKEEAEYGEDPTPTPAANAIDAQDIIVNYQSEKHERNLMRNSLSKIAPVSGKRYSEVQFTVELKGSGTKNVASQLGDMLEACGFEESVAASSVVYTPKADTHKSITIYVYDIADNGSAVLNKITGARGNVSLQTPAGQIAKANFQFQGFYNTPTDVARPTGMVYESTKPPIVQSAAFEFNSVSTLVVQSISIDMQNSINQDDDINSDGSISEFRIMERNPTGSINPEFTPMATIDYQTMMVEQTEAALTAQIGSTEGNIVKIDTPKTTIDNVSAGDRAGKKTDELPIRFNMDSGEDEIVITTK